MRYDRSTFPVQARPLSRGLDSASKFGSTLKIACTTDVHSSKSTETRSFSSSSGEISLSPTLSIKFNTSGEPMRNAPNGKGSSESGRLTYPGVVCKAGSSDTHSDFRCCTSIRAGAYGAYGQLFVLSWAGEWRQPLGLIWGLEITSKFVDGAGFDDVL